MRVAVVHDWLVVKAGAESVLEQILNLFPDADVFSVVNFLSDQDKATFKAASFTTSFIQRLPFAKRWYRSYLALMPLAVEQFDLSSYDLVISSSYAVAKGVITGPDQIHISYVHSPIRYAWDLQHSYLNEAGLAKGGRSLLARIILHYIRLWDFRTSHGVDFFIANSKFIARRIKKVYGRPAAVIYPPVDLEKFALKETKQDFYLTASRFVPYKKIPLIVEAFAKMPDKKLVVIGEGPEEKAIRAMAGPNITILAYQNRSMIADYMQRARAFVFAAEEDFGIASVEAQACGTPVIAYGKGGTLETIIDGQTGVLYNEQTTASLIDAVTRFERQEKRFDPKALRKNAERFDVKVFRSHFVQFVESVIQERADDRVDCNGDSLSGSRPNLLHVVNEKK